MRYGSLKNLQKDNRFAKNADTANHDKVGLNVTQRLEFFNKAQFTDNLYVSP